MEKAEVMELINNAVEKSQHDVMEKCNDIFVRQSSCNDRHEITDSKINGINTKVEVISVDVKKNSRFQWYIEGTIITGFIGLIYSAIHFLG